MPTLAEKLAQADLVSSHLQNVVAHAQDALEAQAVVRATIVADGEPQQPGDTTAPTMQGALQASAITTTGYALAWSSAVDNVAVVGYELSLDGGATWADVGVAATAAVTGRTPGTIDAVRLRARDAAGNRATPLELAVPLQQEAPPPPPPAEGDMVLTLEKTTANANSIPPAATPSNQFMVLSLHGGGYSPLGDAEEKGDWWTAACSGQYADPIDYVGTWMGVSVTKHSSSLGGISVNPREHHGKLNANGSVTLYHQNFTGRQVNTAAPLELIDVRRTRKLLWVMPGHYPQVNPRKLWGGGNSKGSWAMWATGIGMKAELAMLWGDMPRHRYASNAPMVEVIDRSRSPANVPYPYGTGPLLSDIDGGGPCEDFFDVIAWAANPANPMPPIAWANSIGDQYVPWQDNIDMVAACLATDRWFAFGWKTGSHGTRPVQTDVIGNYAYHAFEADASLPLFRNSSRDQNPATDPEGFINRGFEFRNVVDGPTWSCEIRNTLDGITEVDVKPYNAKVYAGPMALQHYTLTKNVWQPVVFS